MSFHFKALIFVMLATTVAFMVVRPLFTRFMSAQAFALRRNVWIGLTLAGFLLPNFWLYIAAASILIFVAGRKDPNPAALYAMLLLAAPPIRDYLSGFGIVRYLLPVDHLRILSLALLVPAALQLRRTRLAERAPKPRFIAPDAFLALFVALQTVALLPYLSLTANLRHVVELCIDLLLPYFVISRLCRSRETIVEVMAAFVLSLVVLVPLAGAEFLGGGLLYAGWEDRWGTEPMLGYLTRGNYLRAQVSAGHSIVLGYAFAVAIGFWLYFQTLLAGRAWRWFAFLLLLAGLVVTLARGPWLGALLVLLSFFALGPNGVSRLIKTLALLGVAGAILVVSPLGERIVPYLPFVGTLNENTIDYRQRLAEISWTLVLQHPVIGSPYVINYMEELRQGQGIIDVVNTYAVVALSFGLLGLGLFVGFFATLAIQSIKIVRRSLAGDLDFALLGASLVACILGVLLIIATVANYLSIPYVYLTLAGLAAAYVRIFRSQAVIAATGPVGRAAFRRDGGRVPTEGQVAPVAPSTPMRASRSNATTRRPGSA